jgi:CheY-like chemotaxis protein
MSRKILVADDSPTIHKIVGLAFREEDVIIETALDGTQAIERLRESPPDLLLVDAQLPIRNGYELCSYVKNNTDFKSIPVIMLVGTFETFNEGEARRIKCDAHLVKPFDTRELINLARSFWAFAPDRFPAKGSEITNTDAGNQDQPMSKSSSTPAMVSRRTRESFLKSDRILDIPAVTSLKPVQARPKADLRSMPTAPATQIRKSAQAAAEPPAISDESKPAMIADKIPDGALDEIVERVVRKMSAEVVRDIAWEVIPEMAEIVIRQYLKEHGLPKKE